MLVQHHPLAVNALRVRGLGTGLLDYFLFPVTAPFENVLTGTMERMDDGQANGAAPRPTFASAFGGALGQTAGRLLTGAVIIGAAWWLLTRKARP